MATDNYQRGVMSLVILGLLRNEDMYGYQLVQETERRSGGRIKTQEGSLYPVLYKLVDQGLISDRRVQVGRRMTRVYYHLEPAGEQRLKDLLYEYDQVTTGVLRIAKGADSNDGESSYPVVSPACAAGSDRKQAAEKEASGNCDSLCPGVCL